MWVVDSVDRLRIPDCKEELHKLLQEDVRYLISLSEYILLTGVTRGSPVHRSSYSPTSKISKGSMTDEEIKEVRNSRIYIFSVLMQSQGA